MQDTLNSSVFDNVVLAIERAKYVADFRITPTTRLAADLALGRFGLLKLSIYLEEIFDIELPDDVLHRFVTVADIVTYFGRRWLPDGELPTLAAAQAVCRVNP